MEEEEEGEDKGDLDTGIWRGICGWDGEREDFGGLGRGGRNKRREGERSERRKQDKELKLLQGRGIKICDM